MLARHAKMCNMSDAAQIMRLSDLAHIHAGTPSGRLRQLLRVGHRCPDEGHPAWRGCRLVVSGPHGIGAEGAGLAERWRPPFSCRGAVGTSLCALIRPSAPAVWWATPVPPDGQAREQLMPEFLARWVVGQGRCNVSSCRRLWVAATSVTRQALEALGSCCHRLRRNGSLQIYRRGCASAPF